MDAHYDEKHHPEMDKERAELLADRILRDSEQKVAVELSTGKKGREKSAEVADEATNEVVLARLNREKSEEIVQLRDEQKILRGMASNGLVLASFSHDLSRLSNSVESRADKLTTLLSGIIDKNQFGATEDRKNPFYLLDQVKKQDAKVGNWLRFSLGVARRDKRRRTNLFFDEYFNAFEDIWDQALKARGIKLNRQQVDHIGMRVFEIDIDSIFHNLFINSVDAFKRSKINRERQISIKCHEMSGKIQIEYLDSGPGLSSDISNPDDIFRALYTTKRNQDTGDEDGTGLGMWIVKSIVEDNDGKVSLLYPKTGFGLRITFPTKYRKG